MIFHKKIKNRIQIKTKFKTQSSEIQLLNSLYILINFNLFSVLFNFLITVWNFFSKKRLPNGNLYAHGIMKVAEATV